MQEYQINIKTKKMISQRKILLITRHGECPKAPDGVNSLDELLPESFSESYKTGAFLRNFVDQENVTPLDTFLKHSGKKRTKYTGEAILTGAFGMKTEPTKPEDLEPYRQRLASQGLDTEQLPMLDFEDIKFSINGFKRVRVYIKIINNILIIYKFNIN